MAPVPCSMSSTVLDLEKRRSWPLPARHSLPFTFPLCSTLDMHVQGSRAPGAGAGAGCGLREEAKELNWLPSGLKSNPDLVTE